MLMIAFLLGFPTATAANGFRWMTAHVGTMLGAVVVLVTAGAWEVLKLNERQQKWAFRLFLAGAYAGTFINIFGAMTNMPGPATQPGVAPEPYQAVVLIASLAIIVPGFIGATALLIKGMRGN